MPGAPHARRRGHVQRARRARPARSLSAAAAIDAAQRRLTPVLLDPARASQAETAAGVVPAAVLVALYDAGGGDLHAVFTRRHDDLRHHGGQISFPGGRRDGSESLIQTALRETHEEIGLDPAGVRVIGALAQTPTIATNFAVYPFVGLIEPGQTWRPSAREVAEVLELSLAALRAGYRRERVSRRGLTFRTDAYVAGDSFIWGATARILADLFERLDAAGSERERTRV